MGTYPLSCIHKDALLDFDLQNYILFIASRARAERSHSSADNVI